MTNRIGIHELRARGQKAFCVAAIVCALSSVVFAQSNEAPPKPQEPPPAEEPKGEVKPPVTQVDPSLPAAVDPKTYVIGAEDVVAIRVWREPDLTSNYVVRPDGKISMPLAGEIEAGGATPDQLKERVTQALGVYMVKPDVTVAVLRVNSKKYYISGEVNRGGAFAIVSPVTVLEALSTAGFREYANLKKIVILRGNERLKFNYKDVVKGKDPEQNIVLQSGDHIIVP
jgi:polysaccharide export outer membrane protein